MRRLFPLALGIAACTGPSVDPQVMAVDLPTPVELAAPERERAVGLAATALADALAGRFEAAQAGAEVALGIDPCQAQARAALGLAAMHRAQEETPPRLFDWHRAEGELLRARALAPQDPEVGVSLARFYAADGHGRAALGVLEAVLASAPQHEPALRLAARLAYEASEERRARSYLARLLTLAPQDQDALYRMAVCEQVMADRAGDDAARVAACKRAVEAFVEYRAVAANDLDGQLGEALARLRVWELTGKGQAGKRGDDTELRAALALYRAAAKSAPSAEAPYGEGFALEALGDLAGARAAYEVALTRNATHAPSLLNLAALHATAGELDRARPLWERALRTGLTPFERRKVEALLTVK
jgi:tetratricopeptide (TPR) repeat protein